MAIIFWITLYFKTVNVGNPHTIFFVHDLNKIDIEAIGPLIEKHPMFPKYTNVEFVQVISRQCLRMRVWERSVGITTACGSGSCAAAFAAFEKSIADRKCEVIQDGGSLWIEVDDEQKRVTMTGTANEVFRGQIEWSLLEQKK